MARSPGIGLELASPHLARSRRAPVWIGREYVLAQIVDVWMGNALVMMVVPEECLGIGGLRVRGVDGQLQAVEQRRFGYEATLAANPDAFWTLPVRAADVWLLPEEPSREHGMGWHWKPPVLAAHRERVRRSLETFLNGRLEQLDEMARSGWFIIRCARAVISELREVPHHPKERP